jgi:L-lactate dehydrogenase complex protein LldG
MSGRTPADNTAARDVILARVREALSVPAPLPHLASHAAAVAPGPGGRPGLTILPAEAGRPWLPDGGDTPEESLRILADNLGKLRAELVRVPDLAAAAACLADQARARGWQRVAFHAAPFVESLVAALPCATHRADAPGAAFDKDALEACDAGITACECLVAQTGSILVASDSCGGRTLSILPHCHVVIATVDQVVPVLADALALVREHHAGRLPSMLSFITGPSRTGDIERILVLGAHGPKELIVILVG